MLEIIYEDKGAIVALKPAGMLSQSASCDDPSSACLSSDALGEIEKYVGSSAGIITRLDCAVGGLILFGKTKASTAALSAALRSGKITKEYLAVAGGILPEKRGVMCDYLKRNNSRSITEVADKNDDGAKYAKLEYEVISEYETDYGISSLVKIKLITGRTHQIRAQFASRSLPLIGDKKYHSPDGGSKIALYSFRLTFPSENGVVTAVSKPQAEYPYRASDLDAL